MFEPGTPEYRRLPLGTKFSLWGYLLVLWRGLQRANEGNSPKKLRFNLTGNVWNANIPVYHCCWLNNTGCRRNEKRRYLAFLHNCVGVKPGIPEGNSRDLSLLTRHPFSPFVTWCCFTWYPARGWRWNCSPFSRISMLSFPQRQTVLRQAVSIPTA